MIGESQTFHSIGFRNRWLLLRNATIVSLFLPGYFYISLESSVRNRFQYNLFALAVQLKFVTYTDQ